MKHITCSLITALLLSGVGATCKKHIPSEVDPLIGQVRVPSVPLVLRASPGRSSSPLGTISPEERVVVIGVTSSAETIDGRTAPWVQIRRTSGQTGYVFSGYLAAPPLSPCRQAEGSEATVRSVLVNGKSLLVVLNGDASRGRIVLSHPGFSFMETVLYCVSDQALYLVYGLSNGEGATSYITRVNPVDGKVIWSTGLQGFNESVPAFRDGYAYVASIGFVGKIDLDSGRLVWHHGNLYKDGTFNSFSDILPTGSVIQYSEAPKQEHLGKRKRIDIDDSSGSILRIADIE